VRDVERGVGDLALSSEALDVPRIVEHEWAEREAVGGEGGLAFHSERSREWVRRPPRAV
jgi:hypothetical protein